jgi:hypothetical protein
VSEVEWLTTIKGGLRDMEDLILARILALKTASLPEFLTPNNAF